MMKIGSFHMRITRKTTCQEMVTPMFCWFFVIDKFMINLCQITFHRKREGIIQGNNYGY